MKILFQDVCKLKINWDSPLSEDYSRRWTDIISDISQSPPIAIERAIFEDINVNEIISIQLHGFGDASKNAYGGIVYIRIKTNKDVTTKIVTSKTRIWWPIRATKYFLKFSAILCLFFLHSLFVGFLLATIFYFFIFLLFIFYFFIFCHLIFLW